jgi:uncharacterized protein with GYD domain
MENLQQQFNKKMILRLCGSRGAVVLEFAIALPFFLTLICGIVEVPHMMRYRARALNAARVIADIKASNDNAVPDGNKKTSSGAEIKKKITTQLLDDLYGNPEITFYNPGVKIPPVTGAVKSILGNVAVNIIGSLLTFGEYDRLVTKVLKIDYFCSSAARIRFKTVLPGSFLTSYMGKSGSHWEVDSTACYMPNRNGYVKNYRRLIQDLKELFSGNSGGVKETTKKADDAEHKAYELQKKISEKKKDLEDKENREERARNSYDSAVSDYNKALDIYNQSDSSNDVVQKRLDSLSRKVMVNTAKNNMDNKKSAWDKAIRERKQAQKELDELNEQLRELTGDMNELHRYLNSLEKEKNL